MAALVSLKNVRKEFELSTGFIDRLTSRLKGNPQKATIRAVDTLNLDIESGEVVGLVGESGCGKSTLGRLVAGLLEPSAGTILYDGSDIHTLNRVDRRRATLDVQMIFQDPFASLNPRMRIGSIIGEAPRAHRIVPKSDLASHVAEIMAQVGLDHSLAGRYPHQFSGGQRQRVGIARALAVRPRLIVCDEAVSALDVSIQAQILNLFMDLQQKYHLTYLFVSHDLGVINQIADRVIVMYLGRVVEKGPTSDLFGRPLHPYTQALLDEVPRLDVRHRKFGAIKGEVPSPIEPPTGCHFHTRCPHAMPRCAKVRPEFRQVAPGRWTACHLHGGD